MEQRTRKLDAVFGLIVVMVVAGFVWLSLTIGGGAPRGAHRYTMEFDSALGLVEDNIVSIAGVEVGRVTEVSVKGQESACGDRRQQRHRNL